MLYKKILVLLACIIALPLLLIYGAWAWAIVIKQTWVWFIVPSFAVQPLTFIQSLALSVFSGIFFSKSQNIKALIKYNEDKGEDKNVYVKYITHIAVGVLLPWGGLLVSYFIYKVFV